MTRDLRFTFVCDRSEEKNLAVLAQQLRRSRSDVVRLLIAEEAERRKIVTPLNLPVVSAVRTCQSRQGISEGVSADGQDTWSVSERQLVR